MPARKQPRLDLAASRRAAVDAEFAQMASDADHQAEALQIDQDFAEADWEAWRTSEKKLVKRGDLL